MLKRFVLLVLAVCLLGAFAARAGEKKLRIAGVIFQEDQFMRLVLMGMRDEAARHGNIEFVEGNSDNKPDKEIQLVNNYAISRIDALLITPVSATSSTQALNQALRRGIKVLQWNTACGAEVPFVESNQYALGVATGQACRKFIDEKLGGKAKVGIIAFIGLNPEQSHARRNGFWDQIKDMPGVELVAEQDAWLTEAAIRKAGDIMTANPDIDIIWSANENGTVGTTIAIKNAGKAGKVYSFGTDTSEQLIEQLKSPDNILQAITGQSPYDIGTTAMKYGIMMVEGGDVPMHTVVDVLPLARADAAGIAKFESDLKERLGR